MKMKKKTYIKLMAATVLASTLLLGACGNKKETTQASSSAKTSQSSSSKVAYASKESKTQKSSSQLHLKRPRHLLISLQQLQHHHKRHLHQIKDKVKKCLINRQLVNKRLLRLLQLNSLLKPSLTSQAMILQLTANFKTNK